MTHHASGSNPPTALVVDDERLIRRSLERELTAGGYEVAAAATLAEAVELIDRSRFDLAIIDLNLDSEQSGQIVLERLATEQPECTKVLASGDMRLENALAAVNSGQARWLLPKPFRRADILRVLELADEERRGRRPSFCREVDLVECIDLHLSLALQPIICSKSGVVRAREALLRSSHPVLISPAHVLMGTDEHAAHLRLGKRVMEMAAVAREVIPAEELLFVNMHPMELASTEAFMAQLQVLRPHAGSVVLEITEHQALTDTGEWERSLDSARALGFRVAIDDLGAGHSTLSALALVRPDFLKVDMSLTREIHASDLKQRLIGMLCHFGRTTGATLITEGIETDDEAETLRKLDVDWMQGYLFGRPTTEWRPR